MNEAVGTNSISLVCSPLATCEGFSYDNIDIKPANGTEATYECSNVEGYSSSCQKN